jgi:ribosomal protein S18 acetylase RimI-like enzyme
MADIVIRPAGPSDLPALGRLGALLMRTHYDFDSKRFLNPGSHPEEGYAWFLGEQLKDEGNVVVLVAEREPISWKELRGACGFIHDIVVDAAGRRSGVATALMEAALAWLKEHGAPRVILGTAEQNVAAQHLFARLGFRRTMVEMTREL